MLIICLGILSCKSVHRGPKTKTVFIKLKDWKNWLSMQLCRIWGQEKDGLTHGLCPLAGVVLNLNLKALASSP